MTYRYEMHCHSAEGSRCAKSPARELALYYYNAGYAGMVLTDHFITGSTAINRELPWAERMQGYYDAYLEAKRATQDLDFDVIFGIEHAFGSGREMLIYGIDLEFLLSNPDIPNITVEEFVERVHQYGGVAIHAHPYRQRSYIPPNQPPRIDLVDGIEVFNQADPDEINKKSLDLAKENDFILTSGSDRHWANGTTKAAAGIVLPYRVHNSRELAEALKKRDHKVVIKDNIVDEFSK